MSAENPVNSKIQCAALGLALFILSTHAFGADTSSLPNWGGVWERYEGNGGMFDVSTTKPADGRAGTPGVRQFPPLTADWEKKYQATLDLVAKGRLPDPLSVCGTPAGYPRLLALPDVYEFIVRPEEFWIITENGPNIMRVYTDGREHPHPDDLWPTFTGDSVGHWEEDMLIFSTISMIGEEHTILDRSGLVLSDQARVNTRFFETDEGLLRAELIIEDELALTEPWYVTRHFRRLPPGTRVYDYACAENNRNPITSSGQTLTLGPDGKPIDVVIEED